MTDNLLATDIAWDLSELLDGASIDDLLAQANNRADQIETFRGRIHELNAPQLAEVMHTFGELNELIGRVGSYVQLQFSVNTADEQVGALMQSIEEKVTLIQTRLLFLELEWIALPDDQASQLLNSSELVFCRHYLENQRKQRPHVLTEPEEVILHEKFVTGASAWTRLFSELASLIKVDLDGDSVSLEVALSQLTDVDREVRKRAAEGISKALNEGLRTRVFIYNTLIADKATDDRLRKFDHWVASRNLENEASDESVAALVESVTSRYDIPQRWYKLKAKILGVDRLADYDRMAPVVDFDTEYSWDQSREIVWDAYNSFSPDAAGVVKLFFENPWIDAPVRPAKRGGAFCMYTVPSVHPYVLLNWTGKRRDVLTVAHELGHALHAYLAREQGVFHQTTPLTLAETASVFGETVTLGRILSQVTDPRERLNLLAQKLEDAIATVFRQTAMFKFEDAVHRERREKGELSTDRFGELWVSAQKAMLGDAVDLSDGYAAWWSYVPHFIQSPGYVYAYSYGQLLALAVYHQYEIHGTPFVEKYLEMLRSGGSLSPGDLGKIVDCDLLDPEFWGGGLGIIERMLEDAEKAAADLS